MSELIDYNITDYPKLYAIGVNRTFDNSGDNPIPAIWQELTAQGLFEKLTALESRAEDTAVGVLHSWPGDMSSFEYLFGMLFTELPEELPEGLEAVEIEGGKMICGLVRGIEPSYVVAEAHDLTLARAEKMNFTFDMERLVLMECYGEKFRNPDAEGRIIFEYRVPIVRKQKK